MKAVPRRFGTNLGHFPSSRSRLIPFRCIYNTAVVRKAPPVVSPTRRPSKVYDSAEEAVKDIKSGSVLLSAGFGVCGVATTLIQALHKRSDLQNLTAVSNNAGTNSGGGLTPLVESGQLTKVMLSFLGGSKIMEAKYFSGELSVELIPQGTLVQRIQSAGQGIPAFYTPTGAKTLVETGGIPIKYGPKQENGKRSIVTPGNAKETKVFDGKTYVMEKAIKGDVAILRAHKVDKAGNCIFRGSTKAFGIPMAKAAECTIVEADEIVEIGDLDPSQVHLPGIFVDRVVQATAPKEIEILQLAESEDGATDSSPAAQRRRIIAKRAAKEFRDGDYVNLGVGMPTLAASYIEPSTSIWIQSENGLLGMGPYPSKPEEADADLVNAGKETVTLLPGASLFDSSESFGMIRGGHVDVSMLGALECDASGNLANYMIPGKKVTGMGGAMDLVSNPQRTRIIVLTDHTDKYGNPKIVQECKLPLTGAKVISRIITELCVFDCDLERGGLTLVELTPGVTLEEVKSKTGSDFKVSPELK